MQAGTHLAGTAITLAVARGFGLEVGPLEALVCAAASLLPDIDTTTSGPGRYVRPVSGWIETRFGHRTITHSLLCLAGLLLALSPLLYSQPGVWFAFLWGYSSHLLLDTLNVNGVPLLYPNRLQFWFFPARRMRIRYGSPVETTLSVCLALLAVLLWPVGNDGFDTAFRRLVASPETAVADYIDMRDTHEVYAQLNGFNSETQEPMAGRFLVVEALGRSGMLIEDQAGEIYKVGGMSGQVVAYRIRAYEGAAATVKTYRLDVGGRLLSDVLNAMPTGTRALWLTGDLLVSGDVQPLPAVVGRFARVSRLPGLQPILQLHAARLGDLAPFGSAFVVSGSLVIRAEYDPGKGADALPLAVAKSGVATTRTVRLPNLPSLAGLLVAQGDSVTEGQPLARYVDDVTPAQHRQDALSADRQEARARTTMDEERRGFERQRPAQLRQVEQAQKAVTTWRKLVDQDAATRLELEAKQAALTSAETQVTASSVAHTSRMSALQNTAADARARAAQARGAASKAETRQVVRSPVAGRVVQVKAGDTTAAGVSVEMVLVVQEAKGLTGVSEGQRP